MMQKQSIILLLISSLCSTVVVQSFTVVQQPTTFVVPRLQTTTKLALSSSSAAVDTSSRPTFDTYQPGVTKEIVWKDTISSDGNNNNSNQYTAQNQDVCVVSYTGTIQQTGITFNKNDEFVFQINGGKSMPGFDVGCIGMKEGMTRIIKVPPNRAYGIQGTFDGRVPPSSDLEFTVTMKRLVSYEASPLLAQLALFGELRLIGLIGCVAVLALPPLFQ